MGGVNSSLAGPRSHEPEVKRCTLNDTYGTQEQHYGYDPRTDFDCALGEGDMGLQNLPPEVYLFFFCELASLHTALREDDLATQLFWRARAHTDALPAGHPDAAVVWCGLGRVAFHSGCHDLAARSLSR